MNQYTIYCTPEQARKALELGAPIEFEVECPVNLDTLERSPYPDIKMGEDGEPILINPTEEQMIGWLEEQEGIKEISVYCDVTGTTWYFDIYGYKGNSLVTIKDISNSYGYFSRKEATIAAIDAALEYLISNKK